MISICRRLLTTTLAVALVAAAPSTLRAEDVDLFMGASAVDHDQMSIFIEVTSVA